jgi:hypothetical protein
MDLMEIGWCGLDWINVARGGPVEGCEHGKEPSGSIKVKGKVTPLRRMGERMYRSTFS